MQASELKTRIDFKSILFTTDFSPCAAAALPYVAAIAKLYGSRVYAVHVKTRASDWIADEEIEWLEDGLRTIPHQFVVETGDVRTALLSVAAAKQTDLLILGTHGRSGLGRIVVGSLAESLFREAPCPVLTIGPRLTADPKWTLKVRDVLLATDFNAVSAEAARYAISLAQENQARLTILNVASEPKAEELAESQHYAPSTRRRLEALVPADAKLWCEPYFVVETGDPAEKILDTAGSCHADVIVLGIRPHSVAIATHLSRPTAHRVLTEAVCPVLTVRGRDGKSLLSEEVTPCAEQSCLQPLLSCPSSL